MKKREHSLNRNEHSTWMPMTDMLASTLIITFLLLAVTALIRAMNAKAPIVTLQDTSAYRFKTGSFVLSSDFKHALSVNVIPEILRTVRCYGIDTVDIIGHTDGRPSAIGGNIDFKILEAFDSGKFEKIVPGSNIDLGFMRALSVKKEIQSSFDDSALHNVNLRVLSAGSTLDPSGKFVPAQIVDDSSRRRIEIRFFRLSDDGFIPRCS